MKILNVALLITLSSGLSYCSFENQRIVAEQNRLVEAQKRNDEEKRGVVRACLSQVMAQQGTWMACDDMKGFNDLDGLVYTQVIELWEQKVPYSYKLAQDRATHLPWMIAFTPENEQLAYNSRPKHLSAPMEMDHPESYTFEKA